MDIIHAVSQFAHFVGEILDDTSQARKFAVHALDSRRGILRFSLYGLFVLRCHFKGVKTEGYLCLDTRMLDAPIWR